MLDRGTTDDPFYIIKYEIENSLKALDEDFIGWKRAFERGELEQFDQLKSDLAGNIESLRGDLQLLSESIDVTAGQLSRFRIDEKEIESRREFVRSTRIKLQNMEETINSPKAQEKSQKMIKEVRIRLIKDQKASKMSKLDSELIEYNQRSINEQMQDQQMIERQQDEKLDILHEATTKLTEMSVEMGNAIDDSVNEIEKASNDIEQNEKKIGILNKAITKMLNSKS
eukprot:MONOS_10523.1-p1 / transcript=MONOS_10523.1 / gene=MONOS_10523 / organism=Monocercomonoides_exilis_PA203 / gene_product= Syntaxin 6A / transcript_product= Syntaxin 6A / location=Mono_scaffold00482:1180-2189(-) / protein_length=226 / sequence_SO=supercontig / SO=protein_coding / is_pseudo=false